MSFELSNRNDIKYYYKYLYKVSGQFIQKEREMWLKTVVIEQATAVHN